MEWQSRSSRNDRREKTRMTTSATRVTVVAVYANLSTAKDAASELESNGFPIRDIYLHSGERLGNVEDNEAQHDYQDAFKSGNTIVALDTTEERAELAADVLHHHSPGNVHTEAGPACGETLAGTSIATRGSLATSSRRSSIERGRTSLARFQ